MYFVALQTLTYSSSLTRLKSLDACPCLKRHLSIFKELALGAPSTEVNTPSSTK